MTVRKMLGSKEKEPMLSCIIMKNIIVPQKDWSSAGMAVISGTFDLTRSVELPFPPQIGMSISDTISHMGYTTAFHSGKIENINWHNVSHRFECTVAAHELSSIEELGAILIRHIAFGGWSFGQKWNRNATNAIKAHLARWQQEIADLEREGHRSFDVDREMLSKAHKFFEAQNLPF
jgi:hypothetical protein